MWTCRGRRTRSKAKSDPSPSVHFAVRWTPVEEIAQKRCVAQDGRSRTLTLFLRLHPLLSSLLFIDQVLQVCSLFLDPRIQRAQVSIHCFIVLLVPCGDHVEGFLVGQKAQQAGVNDCQNGS